VRNIDPIPILRDDGGADFKDQFCEDICYRVNKQGQSVPSCQCPFLQPVFSHPITEFVCTAPGDG